MEQDTFYYSVAGFFGLCFYYTFTGQRNLISLNTIKDYKRDVKFYIDNNSKFKTEEVARLFENSMEIIKAKMEKNIPLWPGRYYFKAKKERVELEALLAQV